MALTTPTAGRAASRAATRAERRAMARSATRTAVLTVALPSAATLGVFAAAAAAVLHDSTHRSATPSPTPGRTGPSHPANGSPHPAVHPGGHAAARPTDAERIAAERNAAERTEESLRADRDRARADLLQRQDEAEQRRQDAARPGYALPVEQRGLSAGFGQAGAHWTARHTGIDFPVRSGTPVHAATDGTVSTTWSPAYGYLAMVTAPDGTQTWYGHLRSYRIRKGQVRAGDVIAYSGSTGNSTGPHLHFEVRPDGGAPVDPVPWLLSHGLDPR